ncbi:MAG: 5-oxoprolinase subunit PxpA [Bacteroidota bacterium]
MNIDLNCDTGELLPGQNHNFDADLMPYLSSCNVACGFHSGTPWVMEQTIRAALAAGVAVGAHPSYADRTNFGRVSVAEKLNVLRAQWRYQISAVKGMVESLGGQLAHVKPHGALYNDLAKNERLATAFVEVVKSIDPNLKIMVLAHSLAIDCCLAQGMQPIREGFADRRYVAVNALQSRQQEDAVLHRIKAVLNQVNGFLKGEVTLASGDIVPVQIESICLHSDTPGAVMLSHQIHACLCTHGVNIAAGRCWPCSRG